ALVDATRSDRDILDLIVLSALFPPLGGLVVRSLLSFCCHRRNFSIRRLRNHRSSQVRHKHGLALVQPELSEVVVHVTDCTRYGLFFFACGCLLGRLDRFLSRVVFFRYTIRSFQGYIGIVSPIPLQVRLAVGRFRYCKWLRRSLGG